MMHAKGLGDDGSVTLLIQYVLEAQELLKTKVSDHEPKKKKKKATR
jgi:hypothetical protein